MTNTVPPDRPSNTDKGRYGPGNSRADFDLFVESATSVTQAGGSKSSASGAQARTFHAAESRRTLFQSNSYIDEVASNIEELFVKLLCESNEGFMSPQLLERNDLDRLLGETEPSKKINNIRQLTQLIRIIIDAEGSYDYPKREVLNDEAQKILKDLGISQTRINLRNPNIDTDSANRLSSLVTNSLITPDRNGNLTINVSDETFKYLFYSCPSLTPYLSKKERTALYETLLKDLAETTDLSMLATLENIFSQERLADILKKNLVERIRSIPAEPSFLKDFYQNRDGLAELIRTRFRASHAGDFVEHCLDCMCANPEFNFEKIGWQVNLKITRRIEYDILREASKLLKSEAFASSISRLRNDFTGIADVTTLFNKLKERLISLIETEFKTKLDSEDDERKAKKGYGDVLTSLETFIKTDALPILAQEFSVQGGSEAFCSTALGRISPILSEKLKVAFKLNEGPDITRDKGSSVVIARELQDVHTEQSRVLQLFQEYFPKVKNLQEICHTGLQRFDKVERISGQARFLGRLISKLNDGGSVLLSLTSVEDDKHTTYRTTDQANKEDAAIIKTIYEYPGIIEDLPMLKSENPRNESELAQHPMLPIRRTGWFTKAKSTFGEALFKNLMAAYEISPNKQRDILNQLGTMVGSARPTRRQFLVGLGIGGVLTSLASIPFLGDREIPLSELRGFTVKRLLQELEAGKLSDQNSRAYKILARILQDPSLLAPKLEINGQKFDSQDIVVILAPIGIESSRAEYDKFGEKGFTKYYRDSKMFVTDLERGMKEAGVLTEDPNSKNIGVALRENFFRVRENYTRNLNKFVPDFTSPLFVKNTSDGKAVPVLVIDSDWLNRLTEESNKSKIAHSCSQGLAFLPKSFAVAWNSYQDKQKSGDLHARTNKYYITTAEYNQIYASNDLGNEANPIASKIKQLAQEN